MALDPTKAFVGTYWYLDSALSIESITLHDRVPAVTSVKRGEGGSETKPYYAANNNAVYSFEGHYSCLYGDLDVRWHWRVHGGHIIQVGDDAWLIGFSMFSPKVTPDCRLSKGPLHGFIDSWVGYHLEDGLDQFYFEGPDEDEGAVRSVVLRYGNATFGDEGMGWKPDFGDFGGRVYVRGKALPPPGKSDR